MPTTRSASTAKKSSLSAKIDASLGEPGEGSGSRLSDVGELNDDMQVCLPHVTVHLAGLSGKKFRAIFPHCDVGFRISRRLRKTCFVKTDDCNKK